ncbi:hypothetical protein TrVE_jg12875 [Triparma verrucosa]|uniref:dCMP deaminase n=2 Tax=Triparma TaxID=722752 RepID=A0A9W7BFG1_9STRA|nr:hypothetical protein TrST_g9221 [Triparma strigata]GMI10741.1 hypothetical protein TrVE_jg12875 [Triparma verrucosa]
MNGLICLGAGASCDMPCCRGLKRGGGGGGESCVSINGSDGPGPVDGNKVEATLVRNDTYDRPLADKENVVVEGSTPAKKKLKGSGPRENPLCWDDYFMSVAFLSSMRSKDPSTQVGACIVNQDNRIVGIGYNGFPAGCDDSALPWCRTGETELDTKYPYVCHAEVNAILNKCSADVRGARIYVALFPCNECAKIIIQSGIKEVVYLSDKYHHTNQCKASRTMFKMSGVVTRQHVPKQRKITIDFGDVQPSPVGEGTKANVNVATSKPSVAGSNYEKL